MSDLVMASTVTIVAARPDSHEAIELLAELDAALHEYPYPPESRHAFSVEKLIRESVAFFLAYYDEQLAACGGVKLFDDYAEVKRMYVRPAFRGKGLGKAILNYLAEHARANGSTIPTRSISKKRSDHSLTLIKCSFLIRAAADAS
jgi:putative acetyltransferase